MASIYKPPGRSKYIIEFRDENGRRRRKTGATDKAVSERIAHDIENKVALRNQGLIDPAAEAYRDNEVKPLAQHIADWQADLIAKGNTPKHAEHTSNRLRRLVTVVLGSSPVALDPRRLRARRSPRHDAEAGGRDRSGETVHPDPPEGSRCDCPIPVRWFVAPNVQPLPRGRQSVLDLGVEERSNSRDILRGVTGFNAKEDRATRPANRLP